jgi:hypothetical protein
MANALMNADRMRIVANAIDDCRANEECGESLMIAERMRIVE